MSELLSNVLDYAVFGRRGRPEERNVFGNALQNVDQTPVIGAKVMSPIGDAVRFVNHQQSDATGKREKHVFRKVVVGQALGRNQQSIDLVVSDSPFQGGPVIPIGRIDTRRLEAEAIGCLDLIAHQCQKRRDDERRAAPDISQHPRGNEVDSTLTPPRSLDDQQAVPLVYQRVNRLPLPFSEQSDSVVKGGPENVQCVFLVHHAYVTLEVRPLRAVFRAKFRRSL